MFKLSPAKILLTLALSTIPLIAQANDPKEVIVSEKDILQQIQESCQETIKSTINALDKRCSTEEFMQVINHTFVEIAPPALVPDLGQESIKNFAESIQQFNENPANAGIKEGKEILLQAIAHEGMPYQEFLQQRAQEASKRNLSQQEAINLELDLISKSLDVNCAISLLFYDALYNYFTSGHQTKLLRTINKNGIIPLDQATEELPTPQELQQALIKLQQQILQMLQQQAVQQLQAQANNSAAVAQN